MAFYSPQYLSNYQKNLYKERQITNNASRTYQSEVFEDYDRNQRDMAVNSQLNSQASGDHDAATNVKMPWGRSRSYAGDAPICLPTQHRPKCEPPPVLQKTHHHFGSGLFPFPRGCPLPQYYDLTLLKRSNVRWNDELIPRPSTSQLTDKQIPVQFPKEHPLSSHMSRQAMFPTFDTPIVEEKAGKLEKEYSLPSLVVEPQPQPVVLHKAMGNFARREIYTPQTNIVRQPPDWSVANVNSSPARMRWFSRHDLISEFNKKQPSIIPNINFNIQKKKQADWLSSCT